MRRCHCPECGGMLWVPAFAEPEDCLRCPQCSSLLEVVSVDPLELEPLDEILGQARPSMPEEAEWDWAPAPEEEDLLEGDWDAPPGQREG